MLRALISFPESVDEEYIVVIERFVILLNDRTNNVATVTKVRQELFSKKSRSLDSIPPTREALVQHTKRSVLQGGYIWGLTLPKQPLFSVSFGMGMATKHGSPSELNYHRSRTLARNLSADRCD